MFKCKPGCNAECCGNVPISKHTLKKFQGKVQKSFERIKLGNGAIHPLTKDGRCIFLNKEMRCEIYASRPKVCRLYGVIEELQCPYFDANGRERTEEDVARTRRYLTDSVNEHILAYLLQYGGGYA